MKRTRTMNEMIFKEIAIDTIMSQPPEPHYPSWYAELIRNLSPVEPNLDEWCTGCKEYDSEHHCCPRFNRVIREAVEELTEKKRNKFIVYLKNGEFYTYSVHDYEWFIAPELHCMYVVDNKEQKKWLIVNIDDFSRVEVVEDE